MEETAAVALEFIESKEMRVYLEKKGDTLPLRNWLEVVAGAPKALEKKLEALERITRMQRDPKSYQRAETYRRAAERALAELTGPQVPGTVFQLVQMSAGEEADSADQ